MPRGRAASDRGGPADIIEFAGVFPLVSFG